MMFTSLFKKMLDGFIYGFGFLFFSSFIVFIGALVFTDVSLYQLKTVLSDRGVITSPAAQVRNPFPTTVMKSFVGKRTVIPEDYLIVYASNQTEWEEALEKSRDNKGHTAIMLDNGEYQLSKTYYVRDEGIMIMSVSGNPYDVRIKGKGMYPGSGNLFRVSADHFVIDGVTLTDAGNHLIQIAGEENASFPIIRNSILQDAYEQFIKVSYNQNKSPENFSIRGIVENNIFQFTWGIAPNYYTGGIDALGSKEWLVKHNVFRDLASPKDHIAQHAVHFWVNSSDNMIMENLFIDNDRGIGFGMKQKKRDNYSLNYSHKGGVIKGNVMFHSNNGDPFGDTGIVLESSFDTRIEDNTIFMEHDYPRAIEYRFTETKNVNIENNSVNKKISSRDGGEAILTNNDTSLLKVPFFEKYSEMIEKLHITDVNSEIIDSSN